MNGRKSVVISVRRKGDTCIARTMSGPAGYRRSASSTNSPYFAALGAAEKFFQPHPGRVIVMSPSLNENQFAETYTAKLTSRVRFGPKPLRPQSLKGRDVPAGITADQIEHAIAACKQIRFAAEDAKRRGTWDLNSLMAAKRLALVALGDADNLDAAADMEGAP